MSELILMKSKQSAIALLVTCQAIGMSECVITWRKQSL